MILGNMEMVSGQFGEERACVPIEGADLSEQLKAAILNVEGEISEADLPDLEISEQVSIPADPNVKNHTYALVDGEVYFRENSRMVKPALNQTAKERITGLVELRECVQDLIYYQLEDFSDEVIKAEQVKLNQLYDSFTAKYGLINSRGNSIAFGEDNSYYKPGTTIYVGVQKHKNTVKIYIGDTGYGIPDAIADNLFDPFVTGECSRGATHGSGLGLAITKKIIVSHHGTIDYLKVSQHNCNTEYVITLPLLKENSLHAH